MTERSDIVGRAIVHATTRVGFAWRHELCYPSLQIRYTYIPKNGCSTLKKSLGVAEGWLSADSDPHDYTLRHRLGGKLMLRNRNAIRLVVLRDPVDRVISAFLDRFSKASDDAAETLVRSGLRARASDLRTVTFPEFVQHICSQPSFRLDPHWRPQADFLFGSYSHVYPFSEMPRLLTELQTRGIRVEDHRPHATTGGRPLGSDATRLAVEDLRLLKADGVVPNRDELLDGRTLASLLKYYAEDMRLIVKAQPSQ